MHSPRAAPKRRSMMRLRSMSISSSPSEPMARRLRQHSAVKAVTVKVAQTPLANAMLTHWWSATSLSQA